MDLWLELALIFGCGFIRLTYNMVLLLYGIAAPMGIQGCRNSWLETVAWNEKFPCITWER